MYQYKIGRNQDNDIAIAHASVSSVHAIISIRDDGFVYIEDLNSSNGTYVNNNRISKACRLIQGDKVLLGSFQFDWEEALLAPLEPTKKETLNEAPVIQENAGSRRKQNVRIVIISGVFLFFLLLSWLLVSESGKTTMNRVLGRDSSSHVTSDTAGSKQSNKPKVRKKRSYDVSCLNQGNAIDGAINTGNDMEENLIKKINPDISHDEEVKVGEEVFKDVKKNYTIIGKGAEVERVQRVSEQLILTLGKDRRFNYKFYVIKADEVNAFTAGGYVFITKAILDSMINDNELACVIGHEMFHNELGHIKKYLQKEAVMKGLLGDFLGSLALFAQGIFTASFNQDEETYCDLYGLDLAADAGYEGCAIRSFWNRMAAKESNPEFARLLSTHPFGHQRAACIENHVQKNYGYSCSK